MIAALSSATIDGDDVLEAVREIGCIRCHGTGVTIRRDAPGQWPATDNPPAPSGYHAQLCDCVHVVRHGREEMLDQPPQDAMRALLNAALRDDGRRVKIQRRDLDGHWDTYIVKRIVWDAQSPEELARAR